MLTFEYIKRGNPLKVYKMKNTKEYYKLVSPTGFTADIKLVKTESGNHKLIETIEELRQAKEDFATLLPSATQENIDYWKGKQSKLKAFKVIEITEEIEL